MNIHGTLTHSAYGSWFWLGPLQSLHTWRRLSWLRDLLIAIVLYKYSILSANFWQLLHSLSTSLLLQYNSVITHL